MIFKKYIQNKIKKVKVAKKEFKKLLKKQIKVSNSLKNKKSIFKADDLTILFKYFK